jgi:signal transduction histidine kinase
MSKSIFAKYIITFVIIIIVTFSMMMSIIVALTNNYSASMQQEVAKSAAKSAEAYIELRYEFSDKAEFSEFISVYQDDVAHIISSVAQNCEGIYMVLADENGRLLLYAAGSEVKYFDTPRYLAEETLASLKRFEPVVINGQINGLFEISNISYAVPVITNDEMQGSVIAVSSGSSLLNLFDTMANAIVVSSLWVMLAALIAVYFVTEMVTGPLRQMSRAAKKMAVGKFDVRIPVRGKDEVAELADSFNQMADSLENLENMRNTFMANVSHDLRTPMTTISGFIDNILVGAIPPEEQPYYLGIIKEEVRRLSRLVSSLLDISRLQAGDRKFNISSFDICETARLILISFEQMIDEKKLDVDFECDEERIFVKADKDAIYQVLYNVCDNAVKFSSIGGKYKISITLAEENKQKKVRVSVYNEGEGIPEEDLPFVFERFYKADKSRGMDKKGVGLGMFISKTIIEAHGESIFVESKKDEFCQFTFTLTRDCE